MGKDSAIEWCDHTFNPWVGCEKVSPGCDHCYAEAWANRTGGRYLWRGERRRTTAANWQQPVKWNRQAEAAGVRKRVFCASLADVFDNQVPDEWRIDLLDLIRSTPALDWLLLTKRPQNIMKQLGTAGATAESFGGEGLACWIGEWRQGSPPANVWLGTTVENQAEADRRIPHLLAVPAGVRFLSCEPLLGPVKIPFVAGYCRACNSMTKGSVDGHSMDPDSPCFAGEVGIDALINWVIAGGESGPKARAMHPDWARSLRSQCLAAGVPFFFKQWGEWAPSSPEEQTGNPRSGWRALRAHAEGPARAEELYPEAGAAFVAYVGKKAAGAELDGQLHRAFPEAQPCLR